MKENNFFHPISFLFRACILLAVLLSLLLGPGHPLPARANGTGTISGVVKDLSSNPITGVSILVDAEDPSTGASLENTCSDSTTGAYTLTGVAEDSGVVIYATGDPFNCSSDSSFYGWDYWNDVTNLADATPITLTSGSPTANNIDLILGQSVPNIEYFIFNFRDPANLSNPHPILTDPAVRHAIAYGTDPRLHILDTAWLPHGYYGTVENSYVADNHWAVATTGNSSIPTYPFNPALARSTLESDGWVVGTATDGIRSKSSQRLSLSLKTTTASMRQDGGAIFVQEMLDIGIEVIPTYYPSGTFFGSSGPPATGDFDIIEYTTAYCRNTLDEMCVPFSRFRTGNSGNDGYYSSSTADGIYDAFQTAPDHSTRLSDAIAHQVQVMTDLPVLPLFTRGEALTITGKTSAGGATLSFTDGTAKTVTSASNGTYSITVPYIWSGTITPSASGVTFTPPSRSYSNILANQTAQNYSATVSFSSIGAQDGWILETSEKSNAGGTVNPKGTTFQLGDDASKRQYRAILSFGTSTLPDTAVIHSAALKIKQSGMPTGTNPFNVLGSLTVDLRAPFFGTLATLQSTDFNTAPTAAKVASFGKTPSSGWYTANLNATGRSKVSKTANTQFRLYFSLDDNNNHKADFMKFFSGDYTLVGGNKPQLVITYSR